MIKRTCILVSIALRFVIVCAAQPIVTYPNGGETLIAGSTVTISWTGTPLNTVVGIDYTIDNWTSTIWLNTNYQNPSANSYTWVVPNTPGTQCAVGIFNTSFQGDISDNFFTITAATGVDEYLVESDLGVFPNPFSSKTTFQTDRVLDNATLTIYNLFGQQIGQVSNISGSSFTFYRDNLLNGVYFIQLNEDNRLVAVKKIIIND